MEGNGVAGVIGPAPATTEVEQLEYTLKGLDYQNQLVILEYKGRFSIAPTVLAIPFAVFDLAQLQRLTFALQQAGIIGPPALVSRG